jgi:hypothetical protein
MSVRDTTLPKGGGPDGDSPVSIPAGTMVNYHIHAVHLREDLCGPEREYLTPIAGRKAHLPGVIFHLVVDQRCAWDVSAIYLPISAYGLAFQLIVTLAEELALNEASYIMVRLLQEFESISSKDAGAWQESIALFCSSKNVVKVSLRSKAQTLSPPSPDSEE